MLFSEVYGTYYRVLAELISKAADGELTKESMYQIVREKGFEESVLTIPDALKSQSWPLITADFTTPLNKPTLPVTALQKRWLKALLCDPRIKLFDPPADGLEDVEPLYPPDTIVYFDRYNDGDDFDDPDYITRFRCILSAIRHRCWLHIRFEGHNGIPHDWRCIPYKLEYSPKDDKFRLISANNKRESLIINLGRIRQCSMLEPCADADYRPQPMKKRILVLELTDDRNALERAMLHFSHLDKETERIDDIHYKITLFYEKEDETELLIRVLSFGPVLKVVSPDDFVKKLTERLEKQKKLRIRT